MNQGVTSLNTCSMYKELRIVDKVAVRDEKTDEIVEPEKFHFEAHPHGCPASKVSGLMGHKGKRHKACKYGGVWR